ncbi:TolB family protein [Fulvivirga ligni]|uniref:TolB family protein n=1 Tax=Fulvivirga ligni TaxID=2904246 RepID=UPI001F400AD9|nr:hypothetical protein [Fulvivirga ligni]UII19344.1 hypothetical protein LVD16_15990 [Fulvivirga ligni]
MKIALILFLAIFISSPILSQSKISPQLFLPEIVSNAYPNRDMAISPDGNEMFFTLQSYKNEFSVILRMTKSKGEWSKPEVAPFSGQFPDLEPFFSPDGKQLFFASKRPISGDQVKKDFDIWVIEKQDGKWQNPKHLGDVINTDKDEFYPSVTKNENLYFTAQYDSSGKGKEDIYCSQWTDGQYTKPYSLSESINSAGYEFNAFVSPDEQFMIFTGYGRSDDLGGGDLYISFKGDNEKWEKAIHLPEGINSSYLDYCPWVSPDGFLYFTSNRRSFSQKNPDLNTALDQLNSIENGFDNIYIIPFKEVLKTLEK